MTAPQTGTWPDFVARVATPAIPAETAQQLSDAWPAVVGTEASHGELLACLSQIMLETAERQGPDEAHQALGYFNGNCGNLRGTYNGWWTSFRAGEGYGPNQVILEPGPTNRFRSYIGPGEDATDPDVLQRARALGVRDYLDLLARKYPAALAAAAREDYVGFVHALHAGGYFTANESAYGAAEERLRHTVENLPLVAAFLEPALRAAA